MDLIIQVFDLVLDNVVIPFLLVVGAVFMIVSGVGVLRMPDLYLRMSSISKAMSFGAALILVSASLAFRAQVAVALLPLVAIAFIFLTSSVAAHMIGRAAYRSGVPFWRGTVHNDLLGRYDPATHSLRSAPLPRHLTDGDQRPASDRRPSEASGDE
ncbi:MAG: monovalent cation/H(+) antiporter subunit G [Dehalococcoidia bacterium]|nr:monovalent cation/H(+) antiporter subunit G [Dehalococcoidia bacterium]